MYRAERIATPKTLEEIGRIERPITAAERMYNMAWLRKGFILVVLAFLWELYARHLDDSLLFPTFVETAQTLMAGIMSGELPGKTWTSLSTLLIGFGLGSVLAFAFAILAVGTRLGSDLLETLTAMFGSIPAVAMLPIAMLWFGLGEKALIFTLVNSVIWVIALNTYSGFTHVSDELRRVGKNYELNPVKYAALILLPASLPAIITGLKVGWAYAWRTLIAAELVFGVSSGKGGLGFYIYENKNNLDIPAVFAGLLAVIVIGLVMEYVVFRIIEEKTVRAWGMKH